MDSLAKGKALVTSVMMICDHWAMRRRVERVGRHQAALGGQISLVICSTSILQAYWGRRPFRCGGLTGPMLTSPW